MIILLVSEPLPAEEYALYDASFSVQWEHEGPIEKQKMTKALRAKIEHMTSIEESINTLSVEEVNYLTDIVDNLFASLLVAIAKHGFNRIVIQAEPILIADFAHAWTVKFDMPLEVSERIVKFNFLPHHRVRLVAVDGVARVYVF